MPVYVIFATFIGSESQAMIENPFNHTMVSNKLQDMGATILNQYGPMSSYDIVNVIEVPEERAETLRRMLTYLEPKAKVMISVRPKFRLDRTKHWIEYGDGYQTSRGTFQKGFSVEELRSLCESVDLHVTDVGHLHGAIVAWCHT